MITKHSRVKDSKANCNAQYEKVYGCLKNHLGKEGEVHGDHQGACSGQLEDFARCTKQ